MDIKLSELPGTSTQLKEPESIKVDHGHVRTLVGRVLTFVDATYTDPKQREATKRLLKRTIYDWLYDNYEEQYPSEKILRGYPDLPE